MAKASRKSTRRRRTRTARKKVDDEPAAEIPAKTRGNETTVTVLSSVRLLGMGALLLTVGTSAFYYLPGMIQNEAKGSRVVNSFYCTVMSLTTVGYGDICPGDLTLESKTFLALYLYVGLGFFCGPFIDHASSWSRHFPGGLASLASVVVSIGAMIFTSLEGVSHVEAVYASIITGTTVGYGDITPSSDLGKIFVSLYCILAISLFGAFLDDVKERLTWMCHVRVTTKKPLKLD